MLPAVMGGFKGRPQHMMLIPLGIALQGTGWRGMLQGEVQKENLLPLGLWSGQGLCADAVTHGVFPAAASPDQMYLNDSKVKLAPQMSLHVVWEVIATSDLWMMAESRAEVSCGAAGVIMR